jgi:hypothetical protein
MCKPAIHYAFHYKTCFDINNSDWLGTNDKNSFHLPYTRHYNQLLIRNRSWIVTIHKDRIFWKNLLEKTFLTFKKWVKNIQTEGYNGARTVYDKIKDTTLLGSDKI